MKKSKSQAKDSKLIAKLCSAIKMKYRTVLNSANFSDANLQSEVSLLLKTKYNGLMPKEVFSNIESDVLTKIKSNLTKTPKNYAKSISKTHAKTKLSKSVKIPITSPISPTNNLETIKKEEILAPIETNPVLDKANQFLTKQTSLAESLQLRIDNDREYKYLMEQKQKFMDEEKAAAEKKIQLKKEYSEYYQKQIEERNLNKKKELENRIKDREEIDNIKASQDEQEREKKRKIRESYQKQLNFNLNKIEENKKTNKNSLKTTNCNSFIFTGSPTETQQIRFKNDKQKKFYNDLLEFEEQRERRKMQEKEDIAKENLKILKDIEDQRKSPSADQWHRDLVQRRLNNIKVTEDLYRKINEEKIKKMLDSENENLRKYIDKENERKKAQLEKADKIRKARIEEMKASFDYNIELRKSEKEKEKRDIKETLDFTNKEYQSYLEQENERRRIKNEQKKKYLMDLEKQMEDNRKRRIKILTDPDFEYKALKGNSRTEAPNYIGNEIKEEDI